METRFYQTQEINIPPIAQALMVEYQVGAIQQRNALHDVLNSIDQHIRQQQPQAQVGQPPTPLVQREMTGSSA